VLRHGAAYEERVTLWRADTFDDAIELAEAEATDYAAALGAEYCGFAQSFSLPETTPGHGSEVFSLMRVSGLDPDEYLTQFFDTGAELEGTVDQLGDDDA
jgi:hypothetical protein